MIPFPTHSSLPLPLSTLPAHLPMLSCFTRLFDRPMQFKWFTGASSSRLTRPCSDIHTVHALCFGLLTVVAQPNFCPARVLAGGCHPPKGLRRSTWQYWRCKQC